MNEELRSEILEHLVEYRESIIEEKDRGIESISSETHRKFDEYCDHRIESISATIAKLEQII